MASPRVLAVVVAADGGRWLPEALDALTSQTYEHLEIVAVDNGSRDDSRTILTEQLGTEAVLVAERDIGFSAAVSMAVDGMPSTDLILLVHDDLALAPEAVRHLVDVMDADPSLAIVGPKLVDWDDPRRLQSVGWSIDLTGRATAPVEVDELDQGQHDAQVRRLVVSTAGMMIRRDVFDGLGRFDRRYHLFRDDLDLCWRAWLAGWEVSVVPAAIGRHQRAAAGYHRLGQTALLGPRYFAERNTLATLIKNYSVPRLLFVLPLFLLVGLAKAIGFIATRRVGDAWQTIRAWLWNVRHLPATLRRRARAQSIRRRPDARVAVQFARVTPRVRAYLEAIVDRVTGGDLIPEEEVDPLLEPASLTAQALRALRRRPVAVTAAAMLLVGLVVALPLLEAGSLRGGDLAPFPATSGVFFEDYVASWHDIGPFGTGAAPSPAQAMLGFLQWALFGSAYLASRAVVLGAIPAAWLVALRTGRLLSPTMRAPRLVGATVYALSPTAMAAVRTGRVGALAVFVALPALAGAVYQALASKFADAARWRATTLAIFASAVMISFEPATAPVVLLVLVGGGIAATVRQTEPAPRRRTAMQAAALVGGLFAVLFPWSLTLFDPSGPVTGGLSRVGADASPLWRWLLQAPEADGFAGLLGGLGIVVASLLTLVIVPDSQRRKALGWWIVAIGGAFTATAISRTGSSAWTWPGVPVLVMTLALAALIVVGIAAVPTFLEEHDFGWRQIGVSAGGGLVLVGLVVVLASVARDGWSEYQVDQPSLPAFVTARGEADALAQDYRVMVIADRGGAISWEMSGAEGPTMADVGVTPPTGFVATVNDAVGDIVGGSNPAAGGRLGLFNVRYVVVPEAGRSDRLARDLAAQLDLEPRPVANGLVFEVTTFIPRVAWLSPTAVTAIDQRGTPPAIFDFIPLTNASGTRFRGDVPGGGAVLISEAEVSAWQGRVGDGDAIAASPSGGLVRIDLDADANKVVVDHGGQGRRTTAVLLQLIAALIVLSFALRAPRLPGERS